MVAQNTFIGLVAWLLISSMAPLPPSQLGFRRKYSIQNPQLLATRRDPC